MFKVLVIWWLLLSLSFSINSAEPIVIDIHTDKIIKSLPHAPVGENLNFLMSSQKHWPREVPIVSRIEEMKLSMLRFPYGHLGDNYLFTAPPFKNAHLGLKPRVASKLETPGDYPWAVDEQGFLTGSLDFDEFMTYVKKTNAEPLIMVNMLAFDQKNYPGSIVNKQDLKQHAVEWVRYANITRDHKVKYWQLGNEVAQHTSKESYISHFVDVAKAMKQVDPSIKIGFGEDGRKNWLKAALADPKVAKYIDFVSPHQYLHRKNWSESYQHWRDYQGSLIPKINKLQRYLDNSATQKDIPLIITEYGVTGGHYPERDPQGKNVLQLVSGGASDNQYMTLLSPDNSVIKQSYDKQSNLASAAIDITLLKDGWLQISRQGKYLNAQQSPKLPLTFSQDSNGDSSKWRILEARKREYYLQSKLFPTKFVVWQQDQGMLHTAESMKEATQFSITPYEDNQLEPNDKTAKESPENKNYGNDLWKSLVFLEMTLSSVWKPNVLYMVHWNTHTSWEGQFGGYRNTANSLENSPKNELTPIGQVIKLINNNMLEQLLEVKEKHGFIRSYVSYSPKTKLMSVILLNKHETSQQVQLNLNDYHAKQQALETLYTGLNPEDETPTVNQKTKILNINSKGRMPITLPALSITVLRLSHI